MSEGATIFTIGSIVGVAVSVIVALLILWGRSQTP
jgi:hypothetical protein